MTLEDWSNVTFYNWDTKEPETHWDSLAHLSSRQPAAWTFHQTCLPRTQYSGLQRKYEIIRNLLKLCRVQQIFKKFKYLQEDKEQWEEG